MASTTAKQAKMDGTREQYAQLEALLDVFRDNHFRSVDVYALMRHQREKAPLPEATQKRLDALAPDIQEEMKAAAETLMEGFLQSDAKRSPKGTEQLTPMERLARDINAICNFNNATPHQRTRQDLEEFLQERAKALEALEEIAPSSSVPAAGHTPKPVPDVAFKAPDDAEVHVAPQPSKGPTTAEFLAPTAAAAAAMAAGASAGAPSSSPRPPVPRPVFREPGEEPSASAAPAARQERPAPQAVPPATFVAPDEAAARPSAPSAAPVSPPSQDAHNERPVPPPSGRPGNTDKKRHSAGTSAPAAADARKDTEEPQAKSSHLRTAGIAAGAATGLVSATAAAKSWQDRVRNPQSRTKAIVFGTVAAVSVAIASVLFLNRSNSMGR